MYSLVVASFSNFLATFDQDLWQALILKRPFSVNNGTYNATTICSAAGLSCMFFSQVLTAHSGFIGIEYLARNLPNIVAY